MGPERSEEAREMGRGRDMEEAQGARPKPARVSSGHEQEHVCLETDRGSE